RIYLAPTESRVCLAMEICVHMVIDRVFACALLAGLCDVVVEISRCRFVIFLHHSCGERIGGLTNAFSSYSNCLFLSWTKRYSFNRCIPFAISSFERSQTILLDQE